MANASPDPASIPPKKPIRSPEEKFKINMPETNDTIPRRRTLFMIINTKLNKIYAS